MNKQIEIARQRIIEARHLVSFSGAGLSAESGIATFRDKDEDSLWSKFDPMQPPASLACWLSRWSPM